MLDYERCLGCPSGANSQNAHTTSASDMAAFAIRIGLREHYAIVNMVVTGDFNHILLDVFRTLIAG